MEAEKKAAKRNKMKSLSPDIVPEKQPEVDVKQRVELKRIEIKQKIKDRIDQVISQEIEKARKPKEFVRTKFLPESTLNFPTTDLDIDDDVLSGDDKNKDPKTNSNPLIRKLSISQKQSESTTEVQSSPEKNLSSPDKDLGSPIKVQTPV